MAKTLAIILIAMCIVASVLSAPAEQKKEEETLQTANSFGLGYGGLGGFGGGFGYGGLGGGLGLGGLGYGGLGYGGFGGHGLGFGLYGR